MSPSQPLSPKRPSRIAFAQRDGNSPCRPRLLSDASRSSTTTDDAIIDHVVIQLNALCRQATFDFAISVGKLVIEAFHSGSLDRWRARGAKDVSFRKLAKHPDLPMSPAALCRSVAIYELAQRLDLSQWKRISTSHIRIVLPLPADDQTRLLKLAEAHAWSVARLDEEIATTLPHGPPRGGCKRRSPVRKTIRTIAKCLDHTDSLIASDDDPSPETLQSMSDLVLRLREACGKLEARIARCEAATIGTRSAKVRTSDRDSLAAG